MLMCIMLSSLLQGACDAQAQLSSAPVPVRVLTYNIHHGLGLDDRLDLDRIAQIIIEQAPDVVCLQEVDRDLSRSNRMDMPALLAKKLGMVATFEPNYRFDGGQYGNCTLTQKPVKAFRNHPLPGRPGNEPRGCLSVTVEINGRTINVLNTHLGLQAEERNEQAAEILKFVDDAIPTILAGDMNERPEGPAIQILLTKLENASVSSQPEQGYSFKADSPDQQIDFVLVSDHFDVLSAKTITGAATRVASDHLPWVADLRLEAQSPCEKDNRQCQQNL